MNKLDVVRAVNAWPYDKIKVICINTNDGKSLVLKGPLSEPIFGSTILIIKNPYIIISVDYESIVSVDIEKLFK